MEKLLSLNFSDIPSFQSIRKCHTLENYSLDDILLKDLGALGLRAVLSGSGKGEENI